jgi:hypothetical protein
VKNGIYFWDFLKASCVFDAWQSHDMLAIMFDLSFKSVHFVKEHDKCKEFIISLVYNYDYKVVLPLFVEETHAF